MFKALVSLVFALLFSQLSQAQWIEPTEQPVIIKKTPQVIEEDSSEHNRMGKTYEISVMPWGIGPIPAGSSGIDIATYFTRNSALLIGYSKLTAGRQCWGAMHCSDSGYNLEVYYRHFTGNSFYVAGGVDQRHVTIQENDDWGDYYSFDGDTTALGIVIGNQWQWQNFFLGCDWIGLSVPIISSVSNVQTSADAYDYESAKKNYVTGTHGMLLRLHLGFAF